MKKIFLILAVMLAWTGFFGGGVNPVYAAEQPKPVDLKSGISKNVFAPKWTDICPYASYFSVDVNKNYIKADKKYWKERRIQFNEEVAACNAQGAGSSECYSAIIAIEKQRTDEWEERYKTERTSRLIKGGIAATAATVLGYGFLSHFWW